jgi:hypothetical protein
MRTTPMTDPRLACDRFICGMLATYPHLAEPGRCNILHAAAHAALTAISPPLEEGYLQSFLWRAFDWTMHLDCGASLPGCPRCAVAGGDCRRPLASLPQNVIPLNIRRPVRPSPGGGPRCA